MKRVVLSKRNNGVHLTKNPRCSVRRRAMSVLPKTQQRTRRPSSHAFNRMEFRPGASAVMLEPHGGTTDLARVWMSVSTPRK